MWEEQKVQEGGPNRQEVGLVIFQDTDLPEDRRWRVVPPVAAALDSAERKA